MGKRVEALLFIHGMIFIVEFKVGSEPFDNYAIQNIPSEDGAMFRDRGVSK